MKPSARVLFALFGIVGLLALSAPGFGDSKKLMTTEVTVLDGTDKLAGARFVVLEFEGPKGLAFTNPAPTTAKGVVKIKHVLEGPVKVWVNGDYSSHATTGQAPGKITVHLPQHEPFLAIDRHALGAPAETEQSVETLAKYLAGPAKNDLDKVRAIYRWITDRISYDAESYFSGNRGDNTAAGVLKTRKCVCQGYAELFEALAAKMDLEGALVGGYAKLPVTRTLSKEGGGGHAWNAVKVDGGWKLFDSTWGAGALYGEKFVKKPNDFYFQVKPEWLQFSHFPNDPKWQLRDPPVTKEEFDAVPCPPMDLFKRGFLADRVWKVLKEDNIKEFCSFPASPARGVIFRDAPVTRKLKAGAIYHFQVEAPDYPVLAFQNGGPRLPLQKRGPLSEGIIAPRPGVLDIVGFRTAQGGSDHIVHYEVE